MIDPMTALLFQAAQKAAQRKGTALIEELDSRGLLNTLQADRDVVHTTLQSLAAELESRGPASLMRMQYGRVQGSPTEMFDAIQAWLQAYVSSRRT